jgi:hypothetical protein
MRRVIGLLGIALPFVVVLGSSIQGRFVIMGSLSGYYYTNVGDFFVGLLCSVSLFLISYRGYEKIDNIVTNVSGVIALGIVAFPTSMFSGKVVRVGIFLIPDNISQYLHLTFSIMFFVLLAFNSIFLFTKHGGHPSREKRMRNIVYVVCGVVMLSSVVCMVVYIAFLTNTFLSRVCPVLVFESIALISFGVSWLVKGHTLFRDKKVRAVAPGEPNHRVTDTQISDG